MGVRAELCVCCGGSRGTKFDCVFKRILKSVSRVDA